MLFKKKKHNVSDLEESKIYVIVMDEYNHNNNLKKSYNLYYTKDLKTASEQLLESCEKHKVICEKFDKRVVKKEFWGDTLYGPWICLKIYYPDIPDEYYSSYQYHINVLDIKK